MLQRAASNAYSWWWASHIRTTQSKWLDTKLHEMEVRVKAMIKLIEIDADSFAKKAELYFKSRPELIEHVEETFRSYQALADRYDRISGELHKANHTIAAAFPDQVQLSMQEEDDDGFPKAITGIDLSHFQPQQMGARQMDSQNVRRGSSPFPRRTKGHVRISSHMSKEKAQEEIERLQKKILVLQTEKEFVKSSYETALAKYRDIERQATEMQEEVCSLQDDFSTSAIIEDNEARALMAARAIISCEDTLVSLQDGQKRSFEEARTEFQRIKAAKQKLNAFKSQCGQTHTEKEQCDHLDRELSSLPSEEDDDSVLKEGKLELQEVCQKVKEQFESRSESSVVELAEKVDELVEKVINLELAASSQNAQIDRMKTEADELHKRLNSLEEDKAALVGDSNKPAERLRQAEEVLQTAQRIESSVRHENGNIHKQLTEACNDLTDFMEKLDDPKPHGSELVVDSSRGSEGITSEEVTKGTASKPGTLPKRLQDNSGTSKSVNKESSDSLYDSSNEMATQDEESEGPMVWQQLVLNGLDGKDKILLKEYTSMLHNYKDTTKKLSEIEKKNQEYHLEAMSEVKDLKSANAKKDNEIHNLRRMLSSLQAKLNASLVQNDEKSEESSKRSTTPIPEDIDMAEIEEYIKQCSVEEPHASSVIEEKVRAEIDRVLEENLDFWLRFSTSYHQIQKFQEAFDKQKTEMDKLTDAKVQECSDTTSSNQLVTKQESAALEKKFRDLNTGLQVWLEKNVLLKGELESKFSSLCSIQEEISKVTTLGRTDGVHFTPFQAAKFQGEVLNLKQENKKVAKELQAGLDHVRGLQVEVGRAILKLRENPELSIVRCNRAQQNFKTLSTKAAIPLRTFLFGTKQKKTSLFSCMGPVVPKQYTDMRPGLFR